MVSTLTTLTNLQRVSYNKVLLARAKPYTPGFKDARKARIPTREGTTMEWRIMGNAATEADLLRYGTGMSLATTALVEGTPPSESVFKVNKVTKAVAQYGAFVKASDLLVHQSINDTWAEIFAMLGEQAGQTLHTLLMNQIVGGLNVQYAGAATTRATVGATMLMSGAEIREAVRTLERGKAQRFSDGYYHGIMHTDVAFDLKNDTDFKNSQVYNGGTMGGGNSMLANEIRDWMGVRWMVTTDAPAFGNVGATGAPVFGTFVYGPGWYGTVDLEAQGMGSVSDLGVSGLRIRAVPVEEETKDDPLGQYGTAGWKASFGAVILQEWCGVRVESSATA